MTLYLAYGNKVVKYMEYSYLLIIHLRVRVSDAVNRQEVNPQYALRPSSEPEIFMYEIDEWQNTWRLSPGDVGAQSI